MHTPISKTKHGLIKICKIVLQTNQEITEYHVHQLKTLMESHISHGLSPADIKNKYNIKYSDFGMFLKKCLGIQLLNVQDSVNNYYKKIGRSVTDEKTLYKKNCSFTFDPYSLPDIPGYNLLLEKGIYHPITNPFGVCRDHMLSVEYGWRNKIDSFIMSHPANCQFISNLDNVSKNSGSCITIDELMHRIQHNIFTPVSRQKYKILPKSEEHKKKISITNSKYMTITNGSINLRVLKSTPIPLGYRRGLTRK